MTSVNKKRIRILPTGSSNSVKADQANPKGHEDGGKIRTLGDNKDNIAEGNPKSYENGGKVRALGDNKAGDLENVVKSNTCLVCDGEDDWVLLCHGEECPIAIHQSCVSDEPDFDDFGNFYCSYCWYKRVVLKCATLGKKLMVIDKSRKGRETLGGVDLGLMLDQETDEVENVVEVDVSGGRTVTSVDASRSIREGDGSNYKCMVLEKNRKEKEVVGETHLRGNAKGDVVDVDEGREQQGRFSEKNQDTSHACEGIKGRARGSSINHEKEQVRYSDVGEEREPHRRCDDINHETSQSHSFVVGVKTRKKRRYSEKNQQNKTVAGTHEQNDFINDDRSQVRDFGLGEGRSRQGCCHENNQQKKVSSTERREQEVPRTADIRVSHGSTLGEGRYREGRHIEKNKRTETIETKTREKEISKDMKRKRERRMQRDGDDFFLVESRDRKCQADMRNDDVAYNEQENGFSTDEHAERNSVSSISSPESTDNVNKRNAASQELALIIHPKAGVQERPTEAQPLSSISPENPSFQPENYGHKSYLEMNATTYNDPGQRKFVLCSDKKRKRLFWTQAEEEMLRVGVQKFPGVRNIPWRKILKFGGDVFQGGRVPSDLKDKWKLMNKVPSSTGRWVSLSTERQPNYYVSEVNSE